MRIHALLVCALPLATSHSTQYPHLAAVTIEDSGDARIVSDGYGAYILRLGSALLREASADDVWLVLATL